MHSSLGSVQSSLHDEKFFSNSLLFFFIISPLTAFSLQFLQAPYGRHHRKGWGPTISAPLGWFLMESPTLWLTVLLFPLGRNYSNPPSLLLISFFLLHYFHRTCIYPLRLTFFGRRNTTPFPISVAIIAFFFNLLNAYVQTRWISHYGDYRKTGWWFWGRVVLGTTLFLLGMAVNVRSDQVLVTLKGQDGLYKMPRGGLFEVISCPNYFGEILEWFGWAVMTWSLAGFAVFIYTCANLIPRARAYRTWYFQKFPEDYPKSMKAIVPFVY